MTTVTGNENQKLEDKIDKLTEKLTSELTEIKVSIADLKGDIRALNETVKGLDKRLDGVEIFIRLVGGGIIVGLLLALSKYLFFSQSI